ncbi:hypothetical protein FIV06_24030 [Labrenzia sp. THAF191b]|nr:hypothetical protein FIV06_24030 [Labrenzia sp. THAF191b]QFT06832.1 hypothetical protein FIV05_24025 [Labrenzia sp. THAF191a]QFT18376.1 hypothetical protein FIV03_24040 [Labrenzia sp. THAF187b]
MKENYVQNLPLEHVEQGCSDSLGVFFYRIWKETGGRMPGENSPIVEYLPKLVILKTIHSLEDSPDILFVGEESLFAKLLPQAADPRNAQPRLEIEPEYRRQVRESYIQASKGAARFDVIGSNYLLPGGIEWLNIERILLPFTAPESGLRWIYCYSMLREVRKTKDQPNQKDLSDYSPLYAGLDQLLLAPDPR